jgi:sec-independent protein translocase protein TatA
MFGLSIWELLIVLAIVVMVFGTKRFKTLGSDLGSAIKGFRTAIKDESADKKGTKSQESVINAEVDAEVKVTDNKTNV